MSHVFEVEQWIEAPLERVFRFFSDPRNLSVISPPSSGARLQNLHLVAPQVQGVEGLERLAGAGSEIVISVRLLPYFPLRHTWTARVVEYQWCEHFRDVQVEGPFKKFDHTHSFKAERDGTRLTDHVEYEVGFGPAGRMADFLLVRSILRQMFTYRHAATARALER